MAGIEQRLIDRVREARAHKQPLNLQGNGSKCFLGRQPQGEPLILADHTGIVNYHPEELVITARAGTPVAELTVALNEREQMLAFEPPTSEGQASIGGTLAALQSGPGRAFYGSVRDMLLGVRLINGKGEHLRFGGQVMKNVAGYDVSRLQAGAMGTLGAITEVSFKVLPKPASSVTLRQEMGADEAIRRMNDYAATGKPMTASCWVDGALYIRVAGAESAVAAAADTWGGDRIDTGEAFWASIRERRHAAFQTGEQQKLARFSVRSTAPTPGGHALCVEWNGALRWLVTDRSFDELQNEAEAAGGTVSLVRGGDRLQEVYHRQAPVNRQLHQRVKQALDPDGLFNPGRLYSWL